MLCSHCVFRFHYRSSRMLTRWVCGWSASQPTAIWSPFASIAVICTSKHHHRWNRGLNCRIHLHQPTAEAIGLLDEIAKKQRLIINMAHLALDLIVRDRSEANALNDYLNGHLVKLWHGKHQVNFTYGTRYTSRRRWGVQQLVTYADRPSKAAPEAPCVHIEWRSNGLAQVRSIKIKGPSDLLGLDHRKFWRRHLILEEVKVEVLGRQALRLGRSKKPVSKWYRPGVGYPDWVIRVGTLLLRHLAKSPEEPSVQETQDWAAKQLWCTVRRITRRLLNGPFMPADSGFLLRSDR